MDNKQTIKVITDQIEEIQVKQGFPDVNKVISETSTKVKEFAIYELSKSFSSTIQNIKHIISSIDNKEAPKLSSVTLSLSIDAKGEFSLIGTLKGGVSANSTITLTFNLDNHDHDSNE